MTPEVIMRLARRLPPQPITRFAPSPTGYLHLGHVANAIFVWGVARALGGKVLLRLEDHDRGRCRSEYETALLDDLDWLGFEPDAVAERQSACDAVYAAAVEQLAARHRMYACECSRRDIAAEAGDPPQEEARYSGRCRSRGLPIAAGRGVRVVIDEGVEQFDDVLLGSQQQEPARQCGDLLLRDRLGNWTYQFAVTVDDVRQGISLVVRGQDLLSSTGRQIALARMLGRSTPPVYLHHPLIRKPSGDKLSKANRDTGIGELRAAGQRPAAVLGTAAFLTGLLPHPRDLAVRDLASLFFED